MRKKSHILLAEYLMAETGMNLPMGCRTAFYMGSVLPDVSPAMLRIPHTFNRSYDKFIAELGLAWELISARGVRDSIAWKHLGVAIHYLADYFTFPHNSTYPGSLADHCIYESRLKYALRTFVKTQRAGHILEFQTRWAADFFENHNLYAYIEEMHRFYLDKNHTPEDDCRWILTVTSAVLSYAGRMIMQENGETACLPMAG